MNKKKKALLKDKVQRKTVWGQLNFCRVKDGFALMPIKLGSVFYDWCKDEVVMFVHSRAVPITVRVQ